MPHLALHVWPREAPLTPFKACQHCGPQQSCKVDSLSFVSGKRFEISLYGAGIGIRLRRVAWNVAAVFIVTLDHFSLTLRQCLLYLIR